MTIFKFVIKITIIIILDNLFLSSKSLLHPEPVKKEFFTAWVKQSK